MSDHISGPRALADPIADITDVYAFPSPETPGRLVLVVNTLPMAKPHDLFSAGLLYRFRLRPLTAPASGRVRVGRSSRATRSWSLDCVFDAPEHVSDPVTGQPGHEQHGTCVTPGGEPVSFRVNDEAGGAGRGMRVFAGVRWDPFIMDARAALATIATREARVHRSRVDLPGRQERAGHRRRDRHRLPGRTGRSSASSPRP